MLGRPCARGPVVWLREGRLQCWEHSEARSCFPAQVETARARGSRGGAQAPAAPSDPSAAQLPAQKAEV